VVIKIRSVQQQASLLTNDFGYAGMGVTEGIDSDTADEIEIAVAVEIVDVATFAAMKGE